MLNLGLVHFNDPNQKFVNSPDDLRHLPAEIDQASAALVQDPVSTPTPALKRNVLQAICDIFERMQVDYGPDALFKRLLPEIDELHTRFQDANISLGIHDLPDMDDGKGVVEFDFMYLGHPNDKLSLFVHIPMSYPDLTENEQLEYHVSVEGGPAPDEIQESIKESLKKKIEKLKELISIEPISITTLVLEWYDVIRSLVKHDLEEEKTN